MSKIYSPKIVTDSLVMCLDASNNKSYPTDLPVKNGLALWLDAADDTTFSYSSGTTVSQWRDKSGLNNHSSQATVGNQPSRSTFQNSRKTVNFDGTNDFLDGTSALTLANGYTAFTIVKSSATGERDIITSTPAAQSTDIYLYQQASSGKFGNWSNVYTSNPISLNVWYLFSTNVSSVGSETLYLNGSSQASNSRSLTNTRGYRVGAYYTGSSSGEYWSGEIAEILIFNRSLSSTEMKQVHTYLGQKWGISNTDRSIVDLAGNNIGSFGGAAGSQTVANMPTFDFYNKGTLRFDGGDYVLTATPVLPVSHTSPFTLEAFCCPSTVSVAYQTVLGTMSSFSQIGFANNTFAAGRNGGGGGFLRNSLATVFANTWYHICMTYDGTNASFYLNGSFLSTQTIGGNGVNNGVSLLGSYSSSSPLETFNGTIASARIYSKALSAVEVAQNYEAQKSKFANTIVQQGLVLNIDIDNPYSYAGAGATVYDTSVTALSWTATNTTYNSSPIKYLSYNGSNSSLVSSTSTAYDSQTITMECWCYPSSLSQSGFLFEKGAVNTQYSMFFNGDGVFYFRTISISTQDLSFTSSAYLTANAWNHIVCTYGAGTKTVYINGAQGPQQTSLTGTLPTGQTNQYIGKYGAAGDNYPFNGRIAESRVYNIALSAAQVLQNYNATRTKYGL
jgi:hypothetical protein